MAKPQQQELISEGKLNEVIIVRTRRADGSLREQQDFSFCPSMAEQHTAHLSDLNYLIKKYKPDELAQYVAARQAHRNEVVGHDFSQEPDYQGAKNVVYIAKKLYDSLPQDIRQNFKNQLEFFKFIDNPANQEKMIKLGLLKPKEVEDLNKTKSPDPKATEPPVTPKTTTTKEEDKK